MAKSRSKKHQAELAIVNKRGRGSRARHTPRIEGQMIQADRNRLRALDLRGPPNFFSYRKIASELKIDRQTAYEYVMGGWASLIEQVAEKKAQFLAQIFEENDTIRRRLRPLALHKALLITDDTGEPLDPEGEDGEPKLTIKNIAMSTYDASLKAIDRLIKMRELELKALGIVVNPKLPEGAGNNEAGMLTPEMLEAIINATGGRLPDRTKKAAVRELQFEMITV